MNNEHTPSSSAFYNLRIKDQIIAFTKELTYALYDRPEKQAAALKTLEKELLGFAAELELPNTAKVWSEFVPQLVGIRAKLDQDAQAMLAGDPAARSITEVYLAYPGFYAVMVYRLSHALHQLGLPLIPRMMSECAHALTGVDIHPGATIGSPFYIDHGTGIVIGETSIIHDHVKIYQGVTLGGVVVDKVLADTKRHPTIESHVTIYANATILGGSITVGAYSTIGANVWITKSVPPHSIVKHQSQTKLKPKSENHIIDLVGNTPLARVRNLVTKPDLKLFLKLEGLNPGGSVKDRPARNMIQEVLRRGEVKPGDTLVEATSGNTGIALAYLAKASGLNMVLVMPHTATPERVQIMRAYGAEVILTRDERGIEASRDKAMELSQQHGYTILDQFGNHDNWRAHFKTTGPEIWRDTGGKITHFVSSMGTTGTIMGTSAFLKAQNPNIKIIGVQPKEGSRIPGIRKWSPEYLPAIYDASRVDEIYEVDAEEAKATARKLATEEGIFAGISSGGAAAVALRLAEKLDSGLIVSIACDGGSRYLSSDLYPLDVELEG